MTSLTVLLVDDDEVDRMATRRALRGVCTLVEAQSVTEAEDKLSARRFDLVLLDYFIPPDTGPEVLARLRKKQPHLPCIFLSGQGSESVVVEAMKAGAEDYLPKSAVGEPRRLAQLIERTFEASQLRLQAQRDAARLALALEASGAGTWSVDTARHLVSANERFRVLFGLEGHDWPVEVWLARFKADDAGKLRAMLDEGSVQLQAELVGAPPRWVELRGRREPEGTSIFGTVVDVTEGKAAEARTLAMKDRLMGIASHDLKNPLSAVKMGAMMLSKSSALEDKDRRVVQHISTSAERMTRLISQLLDLTRVRLGGGIPLERQTIDLKPLVDGIVEEARLGSGRPVEAQTASVQVSADPDRIQQVISNLVGNALTHGTPTRPILVTVLEQGGQAEVAVQNHGPVISAELLENLFEPFVQGGRTTTREGLGLGLFISREVMQAHGGTLSATSSPEGVTRFVAKFPLR